MTPSKGEQRLYYDVDVSPGGLGSFFDVTAPHVTNITLFVEAESPVPGTLLYTVHLVQVESPVSGTPLHIVYLTAVEDLQDTNRCRAPTLPWHATKTTFMQIL